MKSMAGHLILLLRNRPSRRNLLLLLRFVAMLVALVVAFSVLFHYLMAYEGREFSWMTGLYWTLTVMSTLGFGDITFNSDLGRFFSLVVLMSGILMLLVLLPFTFIQFFYAPWVEAQSAARAPRELPPSTTGHVILTRYDAVTAGLIARLNQYGHEYVLVVPELQEALRLHDQRVRVMVGELDSPETWRLCRAERAALVAATSEDALNTNIAFTVREVSATVPIVATADVLTSVSILKLAGANHVLQLSEVMGESLARRIVGGDAISHVIGSLESLLIAEANASRTPLVGKTIAENRLAELGVTVVGVWDRGRFEVARPQTMINASTVLVLAGTRQQLDHYDEAFAIYNVSGDPVVLIGAGRVGRATARALHGRGIDCHIIEKRPDMLPPSLGPGPGPGPADSSAAAGDHASAGRVADRAGETSAGAGQVGGARAPTADVLTAGADTLTAGVPTADVPATGVPTAGAPTAGVLTAGVPAAGVPAAGVPAAGVPTAGAGRYIMGDAADVEVLRRAGIERAPAVLLTSHDDALNTYLTLLLRNLRPDIQIVSRATAERNVSTLHRAGADFVISMASMGVGMIMNLLQRASILTVAEGLNIIRIPTPRALVGRTLIDTPIRSDTGATVIAIVDDTGMHVNPDPRTPIPAGSALLLICTLEAEQRFLERYR